MKFAKLLKEAIEREFDEKARKAVEGDNNVGVK